MTFATLIGSAGVALLLAAFLLNLLKVLPVDGAAYAALNVFGAGLACWSAWLNQFVPFVVLEGVWTAVALVWLFRCLHYRRSVQR